MNATALGTTVNLASLKDTATGFAAGAGVEYAITNNVLAKVEFLYIQANASASGPIALVGGTVGETATIKESVIRVGVNARFP